MFASSPVFDHFKLIKKAVTMRFEDLKNGAANNLKVDSIRELGLTADNRTFTVRRVFIDTPKSDRFLEVGWVLNENIPCCLTCFKDFGTFTRRHHCRGCGTLMCKSCSYNSLIEGFPALKKQIVCKKCMSETVSAVKLNNKLNWGISVYDAPGKVVVPNNSKPPSPVPSPQPSPVVTVKKARAMTEAFTLEAIPTPGFVIKTQCATEPDTPVFINVFHHPYVVDTEFNLSYVAAADRRPESPTSGTTAESVPTPADTPAAAVAAELEKVSPVVYCSTASMVEDKDGKTHTLYNVVVSSAYFKVDTAPKEHTVHVTKPSSVNKIIQVVNQYFVTNLTDRKFSLPNPINGYVGKELTAPVLFTSTALPVVCHPESEITLTEVDERYGSVSSDVSGISAQSDSLSAMSGSFSVTPRANQPPLQHRASFTVASGPAHQARQMRRGSSFNVGERKTSFRFNSHIITVAQMELDLTSALSEQASDALKKEACSIPRVLLGYQILFPFEKRESGALTEEDQQLVYVITDVRKDASFHTEYKLSRSGDFKSRWERLKRNEKKSGVDFRITANVLRL